MSDEPTSPTHKRPRIDQPRAPPPTTQVKKEADVTAPIKVTKPDWLGDVTIHDGGLSAPAQFSSLALAVFSARCGARSPARALGAHMLRQLWDDWVVGCQRAVAICVAVREESPDAVEDVCSFRFSVSPLLLGIMGGGVQVTSANLPYFFEKQQWVDENRFIGVHGLTTERPEVKMVDASSGALTVLRREEGRISHLCANRSWLVNLKSGGKLFVVAPTATAGVDSGVSVALPYPSYRATFLTLNKVIPSQAVIVVEHSEGTTGSQFLVVDVAKTYSSGILNVMGVTPFPDVKFLDCQIEIIVVMQNKVGENVFILSARDRRSRVVMSVQSNGASRKLYTLKDYYSAQSQELEQVSGSLFSVYHTNRLDIWDCNDTSKEYPAVKCFPDYIDNKIAGGGFIVFTEKRHEKFLVIEASSTQVVVSFGIDGWCVGDMLPYSSSFLW